VAGAGPTARAIAVYAEPDPAQPETELALRAAREQGWEGVACVDDAARAIVLYGEIWLRDRATDADVAALGLLRFLAYMQDDAGRFANFISTWFGERNCDGLTSRPGGPAWQVRALHALAYGVTMFGTAEWDDRFASALPWVDAGSPYLDLQAVAVLAVLQHWQATGSAASAARAVAWSYDLAGHVRGGALLNAAGEAEIHLWGHLQERALADTGRLFKLPDLVATARASADTLLVPAVASGFDCPRVLPFEVSCAVAGLSAVARATGEDRYAAAAADGRRWFAGRNAARRPVSNLERGITFDGIDAGHVSGNSGAESNIEGALALLG
jgi:hypothetical protein